MDIKPVDAPTVPEDFHVKLRQRFFYHFSHLQNENPAFKKSACLFQGIQDIPKNYEDTNHVVEQESTFWYLFGVKETNCYAVIDNSTGETTLFIPRYEEAYQMWMYVKPAEKFKQDYKVESVQFVDQLEAYLQAKELEEIFIYSGTDSDSKLEVALPEEKYLKQGKKVNKETLWEVISNLRVVKTE